MRGTDSEGEGLVLSVNAPKGEGKGRTRIKRKSSASVIIGRAERSQDTREGEGGGRNFGEKTHFWGGEEGGSGSHRGNATARKPGERNRRYGHVLERPGAKKKTPRKVNGG